MAIIEIQFRQDIFFNILRAQIARTDIPRELFTPTEFPSERLLERIEAGQVSLAAPDDPAVGAVRDGELLFKAPFIVHHTSFADARAAGSLQAPASLQISCLLTIKIGGAPPSTLTWTVVRLDVEGQFRPVPPLTGTFALGNLGLTVQDVQLAAGDGVVALRLGTRSGDVLLGPVANRLNGAEWGQFIAGQVFADQLADSLNGAVQDAVSGSSDPELDIDSLAVGNWSSGPPPEAVAAVEITAVDAIPVINADVPVRIVALTEVVPDMVLTRLVLRTTIHWYAHDFITTASSGAIGVVQNKVSEAVLSKLKAPPGQEEIERTDDHVVYRSYRDIAQPKTPLFTASIQQAQMEGSGLSATGSVVVYPDPTAFFTLEAQRWSGGPDCHSRSWKTEFHPPAVHIFCPDRYFNLRIRSNPVVDPDGFWNPSVSWTGIGAGIQVADIVFEPPYPLRPSGSRSSAYLDTNLGVRWVDLGAVPPKPDPPADPIRAEAYVISECMAISDRWGMGVLNLAWLVDPPDYDLGLSRLREWTLVANGVEHAEQVLLGVMGPGGERAQVAVPVEQGNLFAQVITEADETLQVRTRVQTGTAPPEVFQRWIVPFAVLQAAPGIVPLALSEGALWLTAGGRPARYDLSDTWQTHQTLDTAGNLHPVDAADLPPAAAARFRRRQDGGSAWLQTVGRERTVAVQHRGVILLGLAGPPIAASEAARHE